MMIKNIIVGMSTLFVLSSCNTYIAPNNNFEQFNKNQYFMRQANVSAKNLNSQNKTLEMLDSIASQMRGKLAQHHPLSHYSLSYAIDSNTFREIDINKDEYIDSKELIAYQPKPRDGLPTAQSLQTLTTGSWKLVNRDNNQFIDESEFKIALSLTQPIHNCAPPRVDQYYGTPIDVRPMNLFFLPQPQENCERYQQRDPSIRRNQFNMNPGPVSPSKAKKSRNYGFGDNGFFEMDKNQDNLISYNEYIDAFSKSFINDPFNPYNPNP